MLACKTLLLLAVTLSGRASSQVSSDAGRPFTFEVSTIKPSKAMGWSMHPTENGYAAMGVSLRQLVQEAYNVHDDQLLSGGPAWFASDKFDLQAKLADSEVPGWQKLSYRQRADVLRLLLAERFHLKVHYETRVFPVYKLVVAKGGSKLQATAPENRDDLEITLTCRVVQNHRGYTQRRDCLISSFLDELRYQAGRAVIDSTGLTGRYDFELRWTPLNATSTEADEGTGPTIFTALQEQLGLKLEPGSAPLQVLIIDRAEQPTEN